MIRNMKKILLTISAALAFLVSAAGQECHKIVVADNYEDGNTIVYNPLDNSRYYLEGYICNIDIDNDYNVYVLVCNSDNGIGSYTVYKNEDVYLTLDVDGLDRFYSSAAMKVVSGKVIVSAVECRKFNKKGYEARMVGYVNKSRKFRTEWERKSLKRETFKGYYVLTGTTTNITLASPAMCSTFFGGMSIPFEIMDVDYYKGDIYATGWGEREYSVMPVGWKKSYLVRRCPRVWKNGNRYIEMFSDRIGCSNSIDVRALNGELHVFTSGHDMCNLCGWDGNQMTIATENRKEYNNIDREAVVYAGRNKNDIPVYARFVKTNNGEIFQVMSYIGEKQAANPFKSIQFASHVTDVKDIVSMDKSVYFLGLYKGDWVVCYGSPINNNWFNGSNNGAMYPGCRALNWKPSLYCRIAVK